MNSEDCPAGARIQIGAGRSCSSQSSEAGRDADSSARSASDFIQWLSDRLAHDPAFHSRMEIALEQMRIERALAELRRTRRT
jgi:hypothetical protein